MKKVEVYGIDVIKNLIFFLVFLIITLIFIAFFIVPAIKDFKKAQKLYYQTRKTYLLKKREYEEYIKELNNLKLKNGSILAAFNREFDKEHFKKFGLKYMKIYSLEENGSLEEDLFRVKSYLIKASIKSPLDFYSFAKELKGYRNIVKLYFPIDFKKSKNIDLIFKIDVFKAKR